VVCHASAWDIDTKEDVRLKVCLHGTADDFITVHHELGHVYYYRAYEKLMGHWRNVLSEGVMLDVQYEEVVADLEGQARRIVTHCGLDWHDACLAFHKAERPIRTASATQVRKPIYRSSIGRWRPYAHLLRPLLEALDIDVAATPAEAQAPR